MPFIPAPRPNRDSAQPLIAHPASARVYNIGGGEARILVGLPQSPTWWLGEFISDPGRKTSLHVHFSADEQLYLIEGTLSLWLNDQWHDLTTGAVAAIPRGIPHAIQNRTLHRVRFLTSGNPAGFERFFADIESLSRKLSSGTPEFIAQLAKAYTRYDSKLLGPPPQ